MTGDVLFDGHGWRVTLASAPLPDGRVKTMARARRSDTVHILAVPAPGRMLLLREFRPHFGAYVWMLPSGKIDKEADPLQAAQRELREETGYRAETLEPYGTCHHAEGLIWTSYFFIARTLSPDPLEQDAHELIEVHNLSLDEAIERVLSSSHVHTASAYALLRYARENG
ncbi:MAG: ADP-ribose pyrophosphatase [Candidatus Peregrinibacteria bacterium Gr01-1014_25]|nr:MAG: ADP-ribose pyrophosphatase [Candidatus Peregrinibacteria bacterium Gr01-1014_25]